MRLPALKHLITATQALSHCERVGVLGSSALLASFPDLGEVGEPLEFSYDADLLVEPCEEQLAAMLHEALGEGSLFAQRSGYHADFLRPSIIETLPVGWEGRLVVLEVSVTAGALSPADLTVVKLRVGRPKDLTCADTCCDAGWLKRPRSAPCWTPWRWRNRKCCEYGGAGGKSPADVRFDCDPPRPHLGRR